VISLNTLWAFLLSNSVSFWDIENTQKNVNQSEKYYYTKNMLKSAASLSYFLHNTDIYANKPGRPAANFFHTLTDFSGNDEVTRFDGSLNTL